MGIGHKDYRSTQEAVEDFLVSEYDTDRNHAMKAVEAAVEDDPGKFDVRSVDDLAEWVYGSSKFWDVQ